MRAWLLLVHTATQSDCLFLSLSLSLSLHIFLYFIFTLTSQSRWASSGVWICSKILSTGVSFFRAHCCPLLLWRVQLVFLRLHKTLWGAFGCDLTSRQIKADRLMDWDKNERQEDTESDSRAARWLSARCAWCRQWPRCRRTPARAPAGGWEAAGTGKGKGTVSLCPQSREQQPLPAHAKNKVGTGRWK